MRAVSCWDFCFFHWNWGESSTPPSGIPVSTVALLISPSCQIIHALKNTFERVFIVWHHRFETHTEAKTAYPSGCTFGTPGSSPYLEEQTKSTGSTISSVCKAGSASKQSFFFANALDQSDTSHSNYYTPSFHLLTWKAFNKNLYTDASHAWLPSNGTTTPASRWHLCQGATPFSLALAMISGTILEPSWFCRKVTNSQLFKTRLANLLKP